VKERIFDPFYTTKGVQGQGLGMSIVYNVVQQHQGQIEVESTPGKGTCVTVAFPINREVEAPQELEPVVVGKPASILLIDDNPDIVKILTKHLTRAGHKVKSATKPREAVKEYRKGSYDIVLTDIGMPEMTGWDVAREIKKTDPDSVIVFITGWSSQVDRKQVEQAGVKGVISKPFHKDEVLAMINSTLGEPGKSRI